MEIISKNKLEFLKQSKSHQELLKIWTLILTRPETTPDVITKISIMAWVAKLQAVNVGQAC